MLHTDRTFGVKLATPEEISREVAAIASGTGYVSVIADATNTHRLFGLGNANVNADYTDPEFGLHLKDNGDLEVLESASNKGIVGTYSTGDVLKVTVLGSGKSSAVKYYRNDTLPYTGATSPSYPLYLDTSLYTPSANLVGALLCAGAACIVPSWEIQPSKSALAHTDKTLAKVLLGGNSGYPRGQRERDHHTQYQQY